MIEAGEVGAVLTVVDQATPVLDRIAAQFNALQGIIDKVKVSMAAIKLPPGVSAQIDKMSAAIDAASISAGKLDTAMNDVGTAANAGASAAVAGFARIDTAVSATQSKLAQLQAQLRQTSGPSAAAAAANITGIGGGAGAPHGVRARGTGLHMTAPAAYLPGGVHARMGGGIHGLGGIGLGIAGAVGYGIYEEGEIEDIASRMVLTGQIKTPEGLTQSAVFKQIRDAIQSVSTTGGISPQEAGKGFLTVERMFGGLPLAQRVELAKTIAPFAVGEAKLKETEFPEAFQAMVGLAHQTGTYDPKQLPELMREFGYASLITPAPIPTFERALSYSQPILHSALDMDPGTIMFLTAMMQTAGISNTKSGTWLRTFFQRSEPSLGDSKSDIIHNAALHEMGLLDKNNQITWQVKDATTGKVDWQSSIIKMSEELNKFLSTHDPATRVQDLKDAFGERGGGFAALMNLPQFIDQFPKLLDKMKAFQGGGDVLDYLSKNSPVMQANLAWSQLQNILMDIGSVALPGAIKGLSALRDLLRGVFDWSDNGPNKQIIDTAKDLKARITGEKSNAAEAAKITDLDQQTRTAALGAALAAKAAIGGAVPSLNDEKLGHAATIPVNLPAPQVSISAPAVSVGAPQVKVEIDGKSVIAAITSDLQQVISGAIGKVIGSLGGAATHGPAMMDNRATEPYPDHFNH